MSPLRFDQPHRAPSINLAGFRQAKYRGINGLEEISSSPGICNASWIAAESSLSVVLPARNEAASLPRLIEEIRSALCPLCASAPGLDPKPLTDFEIIVVDDSSTDATPLVLAQLHELYSELCPVRLSSHVGQSTALVAGLRMARGTWIATLDADLQNDPADLVNLWKALPGHDVVLGWRVQRADIWSKRLLSQLANQVRNAVLGQSIRDTGCSLRIFPRKLALRLPTFHGVHRFLGPLFLREGCKIIQVPVSHRPRAHGRSHYNLWNRSLRVLVDLLGVRWLMSRPIRYTMAFEDWPQALSPSCASAFAHPASKAASPARPIADR